MRVLLLAPDVDLSGHAGDVSHVEDLTSALCHAGCEVDLFVSNPSEWQPPVGVRVHALPFQNVLSEAVGIREQVKDRLPDVVYERRVSPKLSFALSTMLRCPFFVEVNGLPDQEEEMLKEGGDLQDRFESVRLRIRGYLLRKAAGVITVTQSLRLILIQRYALESSRVWVVPNGVDTSIFHPLPKSESRAKLGLHLGSRYVAFVGNLAPWQGVVSLLEAMPEILSVFPDTCLLIVGDGAEFLSLRQRAIDLGMSRMVRFTGHVPRESVPTWISAADVCVMPSTNLRNSQIGSSALKLREYLACGRPVVASDIPGAGPYLTENGVGLGVKADDPAAIASAIVQLLKQPSVMDEMGKRAELLAKTSLTWEIAVSLLVAIFRQSLARGSAPREA